jgi:hypothetical protein
MSGVVRCVRRNLKNARLSPIENLKSGIRSPNATFGEMMGVSISHQSDCEQRPRSF